MEPKGSRIGVITNGSPLFTDEPMRVARISLTLENH